MVSLSGVFVIFLMVITATATSAGHLFSSPVNSFFRFIYSTPPQRSSFIISSLIRRIVSTKEKGNLRHSSTLLSVVKKPFFPLLKDGWYARKRIKQDNSDTGIKLCSVESVQSGKTDAQGDADWSRHQIIDKPTCTLPCTQTLTCPVAADKIMDECTSPVLINVVLWHLILKSHWPCFYKDAGVHTSCELCLVSFSHTHTHDDFYNRYPLTWTMTQNSQWNKILI